MCIAIYKPQGQWAKKENLRESFRSNPHGAGYAVFKDGVITVKKGFFTFDEFWKSYSEDVEARTPALIHFRIATIGEKTEANCHPFVFPGGVMMHNGPCLNREHCNGDKANDRSDSRQFAEDFLGVMCQSGMTPEHFDTEPMKKLVNYFIGYEKVVTMFNSGEVVIFNEKNGHWAEGCWWSNSSYRVYTSTYATAAGGHAATTGAQRQPYTYDSRVRDAVGRHMGLVDDDDSYGSYEDWWENRRAEAADVKEKTGRFVCIWSAWLAEYVPEYLKLMIKDSKTNTEDGVLFEWDEDLGGYCFLDRSEFAWIDKDGKIYDLDEDDDAIVEIGVSIESVAELRIFLDGALPLSAEDEEYVEEFYKGFADETPGEVDETAQTPASDAVQEVAETAASDSKELAVINSGEEK